MLPQPPCKFPAWLARPADFHATRALPVNLRGEPAGEAGPIRNGSFAFQLGAFAPASFRLE